MVSGTFTVSDMKQIAKKVGKKKGLLIKGGKVYWQSISHKWYPAIQGHLYWYRGLGRWSEITPSVDVRRHAKKIDTKFAKRHPQMGDINPRKGL